MVCFNLTGELKEILRKFTTEIAEYEITEQLSSSLAQNNWCIFSEKL